MQLRILSILGEALNFGGRRMATIMRVSWLAVVLLLIVDMASVYASLSVIAGRVITFAEVGSFLSAQKLLARYAAQGWGAHGGHMAAIAGVSLLVQVILISTFMAPLIRWAGLGERPGPGSVRLPFGPDQLRFLISSLFSALFVGVIILLPIMTTSFFTLKYIVAAMSQTMASFPDADSLHTIKLITAEEGLVQRGAEWVFGFAVPLAAAAPFVLLTWLVTFFHFSPRNRPNATGKPNWVLRAVATFGVVAVIFGAAVVLLRAPVMQVLKSASAAGGAADLTGAPVNVILFIVTAGFLLVTYINLRLYPYPGIAVCRRSLGLGGTLRLSRGWNIVRMPIILLAVAGFFFILQIIINSLFLSTLIPQVINLLYQAVLVSTKLVNSGVGADWVLPLFIWIWNGIKILANVFWAFFSYGVIAGLYGRLYRDSESIEGVN
ncbi:MAG: hypothetical protein GXP06_02215 [Alphaproteobacteria bacterium]|nr:hypothetical protein [Alphaproteobacteria bacterium]